ncbi:MAG: tetratricopeptide repeat protein [Oleiphilaceae bacterium]|nr:tetratricopeptide repeat protein [Oleiphilaceae bacterium]
MTSQQSSSVAPRFHKLRYLIIDDFENFRLSMRQMLRSFGAEKVEAASNGADAIKMCTYDQFDVVLCDYNLGDGRNGQHILEELRHKRLLKCTSLFLMVTAETSKDMVMGAREYQPDAYLTKPINRAMLEKRLGALIAQRNALLPINREIDRENLPEAASLCIQAIPKQPRYKSWLMKTLADLYFRMGDYAHARKICEEVLAQRDLSWARLGKGRCLLAEQHLDDAITELEGLIQKHPDFIEAYDSLADALTRKGRLKKAQTTLEKATELSPNALMRQRTLARLAASNQDIAKSTDAWRRTVQLGSHSIHDSPEHYLALGQSLADMSETDQGEDGAKQAAEATRILAKMAKRFPDIPYLGIRNLLVQARVYAAQKDLTAAGNCLAQAQKGIGPDPVSAEVGLDLAKTLFCVGQTEEAKELLGQLAQRFESDKEVLVAIEALLDEPVGFKQKLQARAYNKTGINAFESGDLEQAAEAFEQALEIVPGHTALNLNLAQVRMKQAMDDPANPELLKQSLRCLGALESLPPQHRQYRRFVTLRKQLDAMTHA